LLALIPILPPVIPLSIFLVSALPSPRAFVPRSSFSRASPSPDSSFLDLSCVDHRHSPSFSPSVIFPRGSRSTRLFFPRSSLPWSSP
jgi:hypothetical protein